MKQKRYITFYKLYWLDRRLYAHEYGLMCTRSWWQCFKLGLRHIRYRKAHLFTIEKSYLKNK